MAGQLLMRAIAQEAYGYADLLHLRDIERPVPRDDEVPVEIRAAGVDPSVWHLMTGRPYVARLSPRIGPRRPTHRVRGSDAADVIFLGGMDRRARGPALPLAVRRTFRPVFAITHRQNLLPLKEIAESGAIVPESPPLYRSAVILAL